MFSLSIHILETERRVGTIHHELRESGNFVFFRGRIPFHYNFRSTMTSGQNPYLPAQYWKRKKNAPNFIDLMTKEDGVTSRKLSSYNNVQVSIEEKIFSDTKKCT